MSEKNNKKNSVAKEKPVTIQKQITAVVLFLAVVFAGLLLPYIVNRTEYVQEVENVMFFAAVIVGIYILAVTNKKLADVIDSGVNSIRAAVPGMLILLIIGPLVAALIMCGAIPMLIYYGIQLIHPTLIYTMSFILPVIFSILTGMSWGSGATIGIVMMGIGTAIGADPAIVAGAVVSGAYFGDKLSPISAATNVAAIAAKVELYDHVGSMIWTTGPATVIALIVYTICGFTFPPTLTDINTPEVAALLSDLSGMFNFNIFLIIPLLIVLFGALLRKPAYGVLIVATITGFVCTIMFQEFTFLNILTAFNGGFSLDMVTWFEYSQPVDGVTYILGYFERGGFWGFGNLMATQMTILFAVGTLGTINAFPATVDVIFAKVRTRSAIIVSSILTGTGLIAMTSNSSALCFIMAEIFGEKYDKNYIDRRVLSRTTEDTGTLLEVLMPWTPAGLFFATTLGVSTLDYAKWALLNWTTPLVALVLGVTGIGTYKHLSEKMKAEAEGKAV
ncbi:MAG: Na+/H+ antiporter NhaC family protein [Eubacteriales bacterium]